MYDPTNGETPISSLPQYGGRGGSQQAMEYYAGQQFSKLFGRNPTNSELAMLSSAYQGDPNIANVAAGNAAVAQYFQSIANNPQNQAAQQQKKYEADAPKYYDEINQMFKNILGRDATDAEKTHFGALRATGNLDSYTVGQFLQTLPEAVQKQDAAFRQGLSGDLQKQDAQYYNEQILPAIQGAATKSGRSLDSSGVTNSLALAAQQQNRQREGFLTGLTADQYNKSQSLAQDAYQQAYGGYNNLKNYSMERGNALSDALTGRINQLSDYQIQKQNYDAYLRRYGKRNNQGTGALIGGLLGAGIGAAGAGFATGGMGAGQGAGIGYQIGSGLGGGVGSMY